MRGRERAAFERYLVGLIEETLKDARNFTLSSDEFTRMNVDFTAGWEAHAKDIAEMITRSMP